MLRCAVQNSGDVLMYQTVFWWQWWLGFPPVFIISVGFSPLFITPLMGPNPLIPQLQRTQIHFSAVLLKTKFCPMKSVIGFPDNRFPPGGQLLSALVVYLCGGWKTHKQRVCFGPAIQGWLRSASSKRLLFQQWKTEGGKRWTQSTQHTKAKTHIADVSATVGYTG